jgi:anaphase-promoting complex subunit 7
MNNELLDHMDKLAALLKSQSKLIELNRFDFVFNCSTVSEKPANNRLSYELLAIDDKRPEPWLALAHYMHMKNDLERALVYAEKAIRLGRRYPGGYQLKGVILLAAGRATESLICFKKAHKLCPDIYTFEGTHVFLLMIMYRNPRSLKGLVEACLALTMTKEALHVAKEALKLTPHHPRALAFVGMVLNRAGETEKAKKAFEAALGKDPKSIEAVLALITILCDQKQYPAALQHLLHYLPYHNTDWMHTRIGDIYLLANNDLISAHRHYQLALRYGR